MTKYPGLQEHVGVNGYYRVNRNGDNLTLDVYLVSVPSFEEENDKWVMLNPTNRDYPDISFVIDNFEDYWTVVSMEVPSCCMDGVNEFIVALMQHQERSLNQVDELLSVLIELLDQKGAIWGRPPVDLEAARDVHKHNVATTMSHPGI